jgi:hypothetical protein
LSTKHSAFVLVAIVVDAAKGIGIAQELPGAARSITGHKKVQPINEIRSTMEMVILVPRTCFQKVEKG